MSEGAFACLPACLAGEGLSERVRKGWRKGSKERRRLKGEGIARSLTRLLEEKEAAKAFMCVSVCVQLRKPIADSETSRTPKKSKVAATKVDSEKRIFAISH